MRFRRAEWDIDMPDALAVYWTAWNESDPERVRNHLLDAVTIDVEWNDPRDSFIGIDHLEAAVRALRSSKPDYRFVIASEIDHHHGRLRYRWDMHRNGRTLMEGLDVVTVEPSSGLIARVDGFFGHPTPVDPDKSTYDMIHYHVHHHRPRTRVGQRLRELHMRHHFQDDERGFGVSAPYWDHVFGTPPQKRAR